MLATGINVDAALMDALTAITLRAATAILSVRANPGIRTKADGSPVTVADEAAEAVILAGLAQAAPALTVVSEEQAARRTPVGAATATPWSIRSTAPRSSLRGLMSTPSTSRSWPGAFRSLGSLRRRRLA